MKTLPGNSSGRFIPRPKKTNIIVTIILTLLIIGVFFTYAGYYFGKKSFNSSRSYLENQQTISRSPTISVNANSSPMPISNINSKIEKDSSGWYILESDNIGVSFKFPPLKGEISYEFIDQAKDSDYSGTFYMWKLTEEKTGYKYAFAGGVSQNMTQGRDGWITDNYQWVKNDNQYYVEQNNGYKFSVQPLKVINGAQNSRGIIFNDSDYWKRYDKEFLENTGFNNTTGKIAVLNFPENYNVDLRSITFYFKDLISIEEIERVLYSVEFTK